jgi:hypothetical protein
MYKRYAADKKNKKNSLKIKNIWSQAKHKRVLGGRCPFSILLAHVPYISTRGNNKKSLSLFPPVIEQRTPYATTQL